MQLSASGDPLPIPHSMAVMISIEGPCTLISALDSLNCKTDSHSGVLLTVQINVRVLGYKSMYVYCICTYLFLLLSFSHAAI